MTNRSGRFVIVGASLLPVAVEVLYLGYVLVNTKPFKLTNDPSPETYTTITIVGAIFAIGATVAAALRLRWSQVAATPIVAASGTAVIFLMVFWGFTATDRRNDTSPSPPQVEVIEAGPQELVRGRLARIAEVREEYGRKVAAATMLGLMLGIAGSVALRRFSRRMQADQLERASADKLTF